MQLANQTPFAVIPLPGRLGYPEHSLTIIVKGTFDLVPDGLARLADAQLPVTGDEPYEDDEEGTGGPRYDSDLVHFKPAADAVLVGKCHAPKGQPVSTCEVSFQVGARTRTLRIFGERVWHKSLLSTKPSEPKLFREMDLRYDRSFGGPSFELNPVGKGIKIVRVEGLDVQLLPNIEDPRLLLESPKSRPFPAGLGPLSRCWGTRTSRMGTYGERWFKERGPWFPADMDWSTRNCAPPEMRFPEYLRGDEEIVLRNIHPQHELFRSRLPGTRVRCFALDRVAGDSGATTFREIEMKLDLLWIDAERGKLVLVWRGHRKVLSNEFEEVEHVVVAQEPTGQTPIPLAQYETKLRQAIEVTEREPLSTRLQTRELAEQVPAEEPEQAETAEGPEAEAESEKIVLGPEERKMQARVMKAFGHTDDELLQAGVAREDIPPDTKEERALQAQIRQELGIEELSREEPDQESEESAAGWTRDRVVEHARSGGSFATADLSGLNLSDLQLEGLEFSGANLSKTNLSGANLARSNLLKVNLQGANLAGARLDEARLAEAKLAGAVLTRASLPGALLESVVAPKTRFDHANLRGVRAAGAKLAGSDLRSADLEGAVLENADLRECMLDQANFRAANLKIADLSGASSEGPCVFDRCDLTEATFGPKTRLPGSSFRRVQAPSSVWSGADLSGADFSYAHLLGASFIKSNLARTSFHAVEAKSGDFYKADLRGARLTEMNLFRSALSYANLTGADLSGSNLYGADLSDSIRDGIRLQGTNLKKTVLDG